MEITKEIARDIVWEDNEEWEKIESKIIDSSRWSVIHEGVFKHIATGRFYSTTWGVGETEYQEEQPFDNNDPGFREVKQVEQTVKVWELV